MESDLVHRRTMPTAATTSSTRPTSVTTQDPMFDPAGPQCWMQKQAAWIPGFWGATGTHRGRSRAPHGPTSPARTSRSSTSPRSTPSSVSPVLGAGDMFVMFNDRPEVRALLECLATPRVDRRLDRRRGGFLGRQQERPGRLVHDLSEQPSWRRMVAEATAFGFDASDLMPAEVGAGTFWTGMVDWVAANGEGTEAIFQTIEDSWPSRLTY